MRDFSEALPKPLVPVARGPLWHMMKYYSHFGHDDFILCLAMATVRSRNTSRVQSGSATTSS